MPCTLKASGKNFSVDVFIRKTTLPVIGLYRRGEYRNPLKKGKRNKVSGVNIEVSNADFTNLKKQIMDAERFIKKHQLELRRLRRQPGIEFFCLDFGIAARKVAAQFDRFPPTLLRLLANLKLELEISYYHYIYGGG